MNLQFEPVAALATFRFAFEDPEPLDVGVLFVAHAADHSVGVHGVHNVGILLGSLSPLPGFQKERILKSNKKVKTFRHQRNIITVVCTVLLTN